MEIMSSIFFVKSMKMYHSNLNFGSPKQLVPYDALMCQRVKAVNNCDSKTEFLNYIVTNYC